LLLAALVYDLFEAIPCYGNDFKLAKSQHRPAGIALKPGALLAMFVAGGMVPGVDLDAPYNLLI